MLIAAMKIPKPENYSVVNSYASDGDRYFHFGASDKWKYKLVRFQPEQGLVSEIDLSKVCNMWRSEIF